MRSNGILCQLYIRRIRRSTSYNSSSDDFKENGIMAIGMLLVLGQFSMEIEPCHGIFFCTTDWKRQDICICNFSFSNRLIAHFQGYIVVSFLDSWKLAIFHR